MENKNNFFPKGAKTMIVLHAFKIVYGKNPPLHFLITAFAFSIFWVFFNVLDQLLFFSPILYFYVPDDAITGFILTNIIASILGIIVTMNVYAIRNSNLKLDKALFSGSFMGIATSLCASCSSIGFLIISTFGGAGIVVTGFLTNYQTPLRLVSLVVLIWGLYSVLDKITKSCAINNSSVDNHAK
jgi:hypothetical protein